MQTPEGIKFPLYCVASTVLPFQRISLRREQNRFRYILIPQLSLVTFLEVSIRKPLFACYITSLENQKRKKEERKQEAQYHLLCEMKIQLYMNLSDNGYIVLTVHRYIIWHITR